MKSIFYKGNNIGVLLLHTLGGNPMQMDMLGKALHKEGYTVYIPCYRDHGKEFIDIFNSDVSDWYEDVKEAITYLKNHVDEFFVMGMSIGGTFTVKVAQEYDVLGAVPMNGPLLGFDLLEDLKNFKEVQENTALFNKIKEQRYNYFHFVTKIGQIAEIEKIKNPLLVIQGMKDDNRYKTSSELLMQYASGSKTRLNYNESSHVILAEKEHKQVIADVIDFVKSIK